MTRKPFMPLIALLILSGCSKDPRELVINDHLISVFNSTTDLDFSLISLEELGPIMSEDSIDFYRTVYQQDKEVLFQVVSERKSSDEQDLEKYQADKAFQSRIPRYKEMIAEHDNNIRLIEQDSIKQIDIILAREAFESKFRSIVYFERIQRLEKTPGTILGYKVKAKYTVKDPLLGDEKPERTSTFLFSPDQTKIVGEIPQGDGESNGADAKE